MSELARETERALAARLAAPVQRALLQAVTATATTATAASGSGGAGGRAAAVQLSALAAHRARLSQAWDASEASLY